MFKPSAPVDDGLRYINGPCKFVQVFTSAITNLAYVGVQVDSTIKVESETLYLLRNGARFILY